ncbi:MAG: aldehyde ferredoxin oxidoreductase C-terminal domain-containing protein [Candidatus Bathyarchaeia archaeon]|nr:aldehyde ferredoxin oxidoreductase [Candidatus Bathyarchaeota archaeon]
MPRGYAGKLLEVDLSREKIWETTLGEGVLEAFFGGRGLAAKVLWDRLGDRWPHVDPLGPENIFLAMTGPLTGIYPGSRICCSGKSPLSNGVIGATASSEFASELKMAGYDGVIVTGRAKSPVYILVTDQGGEIRGAEHLWGKTGEETIRIMNREITGELERRKPNLGLYKEPGIIYIGPAGENRIRTAAVMTKICHAAGYGGYGAVMGSKNLKAIAAKGHGPLPEVAAPETVKVLWREIHSNLISRERFRRWGTGYGGYSVGAEMSSEPVRNWQSEWHDERGIGGPRFEVPYWAKRYWSDFNCTLSCMKLSCIKAGRWKGDITDAPDYEMQAYLGPNLGIFNAEDATHLSAVIDNLGLSGINSGNTMAFAAELYQRGILTREDLGFEMEWGDAEAFTKLAWMISKREGVGDILAEGTYRAALKISKLKGVDVTPYAVQVKGVEVGAHGTRSGRDMNPIGYAASVQGGDHTSSTRDGYDDMRWSVFNDSAVVCGFCSYDRLIWEFARAVTGWNITRHRWCTEHGPRIVTLQQALLLLGGPDIYWNPEKDFDNPPRFYEPLPEGPYKGKATDRAAVEVMKRNYYKVLGWDERGIPKRETLERLGLEYLEPQLSKLRKT